MRTIRIKLYKFSELQGYAKIEAIRNEVESFRKYFLTDSPYTFTAIENEKRHAADRLMYGNYEFTKDGKLKYTIQ